MSKKGKFIVVEGPEGGGKTTQVKMLIDRMRQEGRKVDTWREPGGTELGEYIRGIVKNNDAGEPPVPVAELFLFEAARAQLVENCIRPALEAGHDVVLDRFYDSTTAYQGYGRGMDPDELEDLHMMATGGLQPDISVLLYVDPEVGIKRAQARNEGAYDRFDEEALDFHRRVCEGYYKISCQGVRKWIVIDASYSIEQVSMNLWQIILPEIIR